MSDLAALFGRILLSSLFVWSGFGKLMSADATQAYMAKAGLPMPQAAWTVTVAVEFGVGLLLLLGLATRASALVLFVWCFATAMVAHSNLADHAMVIQLYKNASIAGVMLYAAGFGGGRFSLDALLARRRMVATA